METSESYRKKKTSENQQMLQDYIESLQIQLSEEQAQKEALSLERAKLKVCWEMTLEELASTRSELMEKITSLESKLQKQMKRRKLLQKLFRDYEKNLEEMKRALNIIIDRPKGALGFPKLLRKREIKLTVSVSDLV